MTSPDQERDASSRLLNAAVIIRQAGFDTTHTETRARFARRTRRLPMQLVLDNALLVATRLATTHFGDDIAELIHGGLIRDEADVGNPEPIEPVHIAATLLDGELTDNDELREAMATYPLSERARGCVILAGLLAHVVADQQDTTVDHVIADLIATA